MESYAVEDIHSCGFVCLIASLHPLVAVQGDFFREKEERGYWVLLYGIVR